MIGRAWLLGMAFALVVAVLVARLVHLQLVEGERYALLIDDDRLVTEFIPARRGRILDRHGTPIVDNRAVYHIAVVLSRLELDWRTRRHLPFYTIDQDQFNKLMSVLATRSQRDEATELDQLVEAVHGELLRFPGVGLRRGKRQGSSRLGVIGLTRETLAGIETQTEAESGVGRLVELGLLTDDPAQALEREFLERRGQTARLLTLDQFSDLIARLAQRHDVPASLVQARVMPFVPRVSLESDAAMTNWRWHLLTEDGRTRGEEALARLLGIEPLAVHETIARFLATCRRPVPQSDWFFIPTSHAERAAAQLQAKLVFADFQLRGAPNPQERIYLIQGDSADQRDAGTGLFSELCRRIGLAIGYPPGELSLLIERYADKRSARSLERQWRVPQIGFDPERLRRFCTGLSEHLTNLGHSHSVLELEEALTMARRRADRDWAGSTRNDPLVIVEDVRQDVALPLAGLGDAIELRHSGLRSDYLAIEAELPGLRITTDMGREYRFDGHASHLSGWLKRLSSELDRRTALAWGLDPSGWIGDRMGLEHAYDRQLQGLVGKRQRLRVPGGYREVRGGQRPPRAGEDLRTTIDMRLQTVAEESLSHWIDLAVELGTVPTSRVSLADLRAAQTIGNDRAGLVLMDCHSGAVLALASTPGFTLSNIHETYAKLLDPELHPGKPLHDNACWPLMSPGSTIKPLVGLAAMMEGECQPDEVITTPGHMGIWRGGFLMPDHAPYGPHQGGHDWTMTIALQESSNSFFSTLGERLGDERLAAWYRRFGIGEEHAVDVTWQRSGVLSWSGNIHRTRPQEAWQLSDTWRMAIGQFVTPCAAPLQLVTIPACIANGGTILRPYLARRAAERAVAEQLDIPPRVLAVLREGMERVTDPAGTAKYLTLPAPWDGIKVAAKTGTSEWGPSHARKPDNAWLIGYAPADRPEVAFAIFVYAAGTSGGRACSGVARRLLTEYFVETRVQPEPFPGPE